MYFPWLNKIRGFAILFLASSSAGIARDAVNSVIKYGLFYIWRTHPDAVIVMYVFGLLYCALLGIALKDIIGD